MKLRAITLLTIALGLAAAWGGAGGTHNPSASGSVAAGAITGNSTLWHAYGTGGSEETALNQLIDKIRTAKPSAKITVLQVPFDQVFNKFQTEAAAGGGPDLFTAPNDELGNEVRANLLMALDSKLSGKLSNVAQLGVDGLKVDGKLYGVPMLFKAVALYYNKDKVPTPPKTTDELMTMLKAGKTLVQNENAYHMFGWSTAFGGNLMDSSGKCVADQGGWADADVAGDVPVRTDVTVSDPLVKAFSDASATGFARPQTVEFGNYWTPFGDAVTKIIEGKSTPQAGIAEACAAMNKANKK